MVEIRRFSAGVWGWRLLCHRWVPLCCPLGGLRGLIGVGAGAAAHGWLLGRSPGIWLFLWVIWFHTQEEDGIGYSRIGKMRNLALFLGQCFKYAKISTGLSGPWL